MNEEWRNELVTKGTAYDALANLDQYAELGECLDAIKDLPSEQPDNRLKRIADIVEGTIDHLDRDDAMDMLYQIKEVLK